MSNLIFLATSGDELSEVYKYLSSAVYLLTLLLGAVLIISTIVAGIQYTTAGGSSERVQKAKARLASNVVVLALYIFSATVLNWLLPG